MSAVEHEKLWGSPEETKRRLALMEAASPIGRGQPASRDTNPQEILQRASAIINERGAVYGSGIEQNFKRAAQIASLKLNKEFTARDVCVILESVKDARLALNFGHEDSLLDRINYAAFRAAFELKDKGERK